MKKTKISISPKFSIIIAHGTKYFVGLLGIVLLLSLFRNITTLLSADEKIAETQRKLDAIAIENQQLQDRVNQAQSPLYKEQQARNQLGLARDGETVLVLPEEEILKKISPVVPNTTTDVLPDPHWKKWLKLFL